MLVRSAAPTHTSLFMYTERYQFCVFERERERDDREIDRYIYSYMMCVYICMYER